jgi:hypothetical protein
MNIIKMPYAEFYLKYNGIDNCDHLWIFKKENIIIQKGYPYNHSVYFGKYPSACPRGYYNSNKNIIVCYNKPDNKFISMLTKAFPEACYITSAYWVEGVLQEK